MLSATGAIPFKNDKDEDFIAIRAVRLGVQLPGEISAKTAEAIHLDRHIKNERANED